MLVGMQPPFPLCLTLTMGVITAGRIDVGYESNRLSAKGRSVAGAGSTNLPLCVARRFCFSRQSLAVRLTKTLTKLTGERVKVELSQQATMSCSKGWVPRSRMICCPF